MIAFQPVEGRDQSQLDALITLHPGLAHPNLAEVINGDSDGLELRRDGECDVLFVPGELDRERGEEIEEHIWKSLHFAQHLRSGRLGEFTLGTELRRSEALALTQLLIFYHALTARASVALGGSGTREQDKIIAESNG